MDETKVQELVQAALKPLQDQLAAESTARKAAEAEAAKAKLSAHRAAINAVFEQAIAAGTIVPAAREKFSKTYGVEDDAKVMSVSVSDAKEFVEGAKDMPQFSGSGAARSGAKGRLAFGREEVDIEGKSAGEIVSELTDLQMQADGAKADDYEARRRAYFKVLRKYPDVARAYVNGQEDATAPYKPEA